MRPFTAIALFCEDVREEIGGTFTIVGIMPDNIEVPLFPVLLSKLAIYVRVNIDPNSNPGSITLRLKLQDGKILDLAEMDPTVVAESIATARNSQTPIAGVVLRTVTTNFPITAPGRISAIVRTEQEEINCGFLNIVGPTTSSTEPQPHS